MLTEQSLWKKLKFQSFFGLSKHFLFFSLLFSLLITKIPLLLQVDNVLHGNQLKHLFSLFPIQNFDKIENKVKIR